MNKKLLAIAISGALTVPMAAQAVDFKVGGHVNRAILFTDDGNGSDVRHVDNTNSSSRINLKGSEALGVGGMKVGFYVEFEHSGNRSFSHTMKAAGGTAGGTANSTVGLRHSAIWFSGKWGKLWAGHTNNAYNSALSKDFDALFLTGVAFDARNLLVGSTQFRTNVGNGGPASFVTSGTALTRVRDVTSGFHGGRQSNLHYITPKMGPFSAAVSVAENEQWSMRANLDGSFSGAKYGIGGGYFDADNANGFSHWGVNGSVQFSQGTSLKVTYSERDFVAAGRTDADNLYLKLAHSWGNNAVGIDYNQTDDLQAVNDEYTSWGIGFVHSIPGPRVQLFAGYRNHDLDRPGTNVEDIDEFNVGARVQF